MKAIAITAFVAAVAVSGPALAQSQATGPALPGVCVLNIERAIQQSAAGQAVSARLGELRTEVENELAPYFQSVQSGVASLQQNSASLSPDQRQQQGAQLQQRYDEAQQLAQTRENELRYTLSVQIDAIGQVMDPIVAAIYQERGCGVLLNANSVLQMNPAMDLTDAVVQRLDQGLPAANMRSFNRMTPPVQAAQ